MYVYFGGKKVQNMFSDYIHSFKQKVMQVLNGLLKLNALSYHPNVNCKILGVFVATPSLFSKCQMGASQMTAKCMKITNSCGPPLSKDIIDLRITFTSTLIAAKVLQQVSRLLKDSLHASFRIIVLK